MDRRQTPASTAPDVNLDVLRLLSGGVPDLLRRQSDLVLALHQRLLELVPGIARMQGSGRPACQRLVTTMLQAADPDVPPRHAAAVLGQVGADNQLEGFPIDQYGSVTHAMLHAVRGIHRGEWSSALSSAWVEYLIWLRAHLLAGAEAQRRHDQQRHDQRQAAAAGPEPGPTASLFTPALPVPAPGESEPPSAVLHDDLDDGDLDGEAEPGYGSLMMSMTMRSRRERRLRERGR